VFVIDTNKEDIAIYEAKKLHIPIMAVVDTNCNPDGLTYIIPGNDDSAKAIKLYCRLLSDAIISGIRENMAASGLDLSKFDSNSIPDIGKLKADSAKLNSKKTDSSNETEAMSEEVTAEVESSESGPDTSNKGHKPVKLMAKKPEAKSGFKPVGGEEKKPYTPSTAKKIPAKKV
jgi:small subunit ribosomal protein S2